MGKSTQREVSLEEAISMLAEDMDPELLATALQQISIFGIEVFARIFIAQMAVLSHWQSANKLFMPAGGKFPAVDPAKAFH